MLLLLDEIVVPSHAVPRSGASVRRRATRVVCSRTAGRRDARWWAVSGVHLRVHTAFDTVESTRRLPVGWAEKRSAHTSGPPVSRVRRICVGVHHHGVFLRLGVVRGTRHDKSLSTRGRRISIILRRGHAAAKGRMSWRGCNAHGRRSVGNEINVLARNFVHG